MCTNANLSKYSNHFDEGVVRAVLPGECILHVYGAKYAHVNEQLNLQQYSAEDELFILSNDCRGEFPSVTLSEQTSLASEFTNHHNYID